ncbi:PREDICTED: cytochrome b5 reductase 4 [Thamnophis sirtalis]|uniref:cytochrome-b5 reductase n=1 Tax=Thamnophis sirtalis TaxID=35019 RepID=A0A6I9XI10_9SAUR|nr:PREDICTED: cytochrome b5 reductase 4 [Thamnophis sirtalis]
MDWIRLTKSGQDLTGLKGRLLEVTEEELMKHNKREDCWICIRGLVYNVTPYMEYHPGGEDELMKAAGIDGTDLFDQVHRWVNYESMLKECLVGRIVLKPATSVKEICLPVTEENRTLNGILPGKKVLDPYSKEIIPSYDWFQTEDSVTVVIYTKQKDVDSESVIADVQERTLRGEIIVKDFSYLIHVELSYAVYEDIIVQISEKVGKVEFVLKKKENLSWKKLGQPLKRHNSFVKCTDRGNTFYCSAQSSFLLWVVLLHGLSLGTEIVKPYTPILSCLVSPFKISSSNDKAQIFFMIKIYPGGLFTPVLDTLQIGDYISLSNPQGIFKTSQLEDVEDLFLLAGGTGFTPMVKLLDYAFSNSATLRYFSVLRPIINVSFSFGSFKAFSFYCFDNICFYVIRVWNAESHQYEENCVLSAEITIKKRSSAGSGKSALGQAKKMRGLPCSRFIPTTSNLRFDIQFVLSEPKKNWAGKQGKISLSLLYEFVKKSKPESKILICICGPFPFMEQGIQFLQTLGHSGNEVHCFTK